MMNERNKYKMCLNAFFCFAVDEVVPFCDFRPFASLLFCCKDFSYRIRFFNIETCGEILAG